MTATGQLYLAAGEVESFIKSMGLSHCFIGGLAVLRWGEPRQTTDIDLCLYSDLGFEEEIVESLLARFAPRGPDARLKARLGRVVQIVCSNGVPCDISLGWIPYELEMVSRGSMFEYLPGTVVRTCSAEDLIVTKVFAGRPRDVQDVKTTVARNYGRLDLDYARRWIAELAAGVTQHDAPACLEAIIKDVARITRK